MGVGKWEPSVYARIYAWDAFSVCRCHFPFCHLLSFSGHGNGIVNADAEIAWFVEEIEITRAAVGETPEALDLIDLTLEELFVGLSDAEHELARREAKRSADSAAAGASRTDRPRVRSS